MKERWWYGGKGRKGGGGGGAAAAGWRRGVVEVEADLLECEDVDFDTDGCAVQHLMGIVSSSE